MYTAASFFSGIGGLDLAFSWVGFDIRVQVENDDYCRKVLWKNRKYWINAKQLKDIRYVKKSQVGEVDVMFGGFPCQDISIAGKRAGITKSTRSGLWFEFLRLIRQVRPRVVVLENVAAVHFPITDDNGYRQPAPGLIVTASLAEVGYDCIWLPIQAAEVGAPHQRERWFCIAFPNPSYTRINGGKWKPQYVKKGCRNGRRLRTNATIGRHQELAHTKSQRQQKGRKLRYIKPSQRVGRSINSMGNASRLYEKRGKSKRNSVRRPKEAIRNTSSITRRKSRTQSRLGRITHGLSHRVHRLGDGHRGQFPSRPNEPQYDYEPPRVTSRVDCRVDRLKALGNAVVPQQALPIAMTVKAFLDTL